MACQLRQVGLPCVTRAPDGTDWQGWTVRAWGGGLAGGLRRLISGSAMSRGLGGNIDDTFSRMK